MFRIVFLNILILGFKDRKPILYCLMKIIQGLVRAHFKCLCKTNNA